MYLCLLKYVAYLILHALTWKGVHTQYGKLPACYGIETNETMYTAVYSPGIYVKYSDGNLQVSMPTLLFFMYVINCNYILRTCYILTKLVAWYAVVGSFLIAIYYSVAL